jgi:hypothetical protein
MEPDTSAVVQDVLRKVSQVQVERHKDVAEWIRDADKER